MLLQKPTYFIEDLKILIPTALLEDVVVISGIVRNERNCYTIEEYRRAIEIISDRLFVISNHLFKKEFRG